MSTLNNALLAIPGLGTGVAIYNAVKESKIIKSTEAKISKTHAMTQLRFNEHAKLTGNLKLAAMGIIPSMPKGETPKATSMKTKLLGLIGKAPEHEISSAATTDVEGRAIKNREIVETSHLLEDGRVHLDLDRRKIIHGINRTDGENKEVYASIKRFDVQEAFDKANTPRWEEKVEKHKKLLSKAKWAAIPLVGTVIGLKNIAAISKQNKEVQKDVAKHAIRNAFQGIKANVQKTPREKAMFKKLLKGVDKRAELNKPVVVAKPSLSTRVKNAFANALNSVKQAWAKANFTSRVKNAFANALNSVKQARAKANIDVRFSNDMFAVKEEDVLVQLKPSLREQISSIWSEYVGKKAKPADDIVEL